MTRYIVRLKHPTLRILCWTAIYPFLVMDCCIGAVLSGNGKRLFVPAFWHVQSAVYHLGVYGVTD